MRYFMYYANKKKFKNIARYKKFKTYFKIIYKKQVRIKVSTHCRTRNSDSLVSVELPLQNQNCKILITSFCLLAHVACTFNHLPAFQHVCFEVFCQGCTLNRIWDLIHKLTGAEPKEIKAVLEPVTFQLEVRSFLRENLVHEVQIFPSSCFKHFSQQSYGVFCGFKYSSLVQQYNICMYKW